MASNIYFKLLRRLRDRYKLIFNINTNEFKSRSLINIDGQKVSDIVSQAILNNKPFLLSRFGSEEIKWYVHFHLLSKSYFLRLYSYISCKTDTWQRSSRVIDNLTFKPQSLEMTKFFVAKMNSAIQEIDLLGSWLKLEHSIEVKRYLRCDKFAFLVDIEPYYHDNPWSSSLEGKRVLVIHPMTSSIKSQYLKRELLFKNPKTLPDFQLLTLQAKYFDDPIYNSWEKILNYYLVEISKLDFDVAILGCGSWGMPLAAHIKGLGKPAIHLGGSTQVLFGIIGNRWETQYPGFTERFVNEHWVRPTVDETPSWAVSYDKNSYW